MRNRPFNIPLGLTYDDVLLVPKRSRVESRVEVITKTKLTPRIELNIPFVSANMDTVTESTMAIAMAKEGGIGIIHRFMTIDKEVAEVERVKRTEGFVVDKPYTIFPDKKIGQVKDLMRKSDITGFIVVDKNNKVVGIISHRDVMFEEKMRKRVDEVMTPLRKLITARPDITFEKAKEVFKKYKVEKLPLLNKDGTLAGLITARTIENIARYPMATKDKMGRLRVGAAVGVTKDYLERAQELVKAGVDVLVIDVAHGHHEHTIKALKEFKKKLSDVEVIAGNVATPEGVRDLIRAGTDAVKVGVGPGGLCTTRIVAGVGYPQLSAIMECSKIAIREKVPLIADGGTNYSGDLTKALAAGASTVMLAGWLAGTSESPGDIIMRKGLKYKVHRGSASFMSVADRKLAAEVSLNGKGPRANLNTIVAEGVESIIPYKGAVTDVIYQLLGGLRSGMSYCNALTIEELWENADFVQITSAGFKESNSHNVEEI